MSFHSWLQDLRPALKPRRGQRHHGRRGSLRAATHRPNLEALEDRCLLAFLAPVSYAVGLNPQAMSTGDFNNDGWLDMATANASDNTVSVLLGNVNGTFQPAQTSTTGVGPVSMAVGDFNHDGKLDMATANAHNLSVLLGNGNGTFQTASNISIGSDPAAVAVGDFNGDGHLDLGVTGNVYYPGGFGDPGGYEGSANVLLGNGNGSFSAPNVTPFLVLGQLVDDWGYHDSAIAADLNGDGLDDFVTVNIDQGFVIVLLGDSSGYLQGPSVFSTGYHHPFEVAAGDLDADGHIDLVTTNYFNNNVSVLLGDGFGSFNSGGNYSAGDQPYEAVLGDFTGDGKVDVATSNILSDNGIYVYHLSVLYGGGDGTLSPAVNFGVGSYVSGMAAGDFNGDGWLDAASANRYGASVSVLINDQSWPSPPPPAVSVSDATVTEGNTGTVNATFTLTLSYASAVDVTVHYGTADVTATAGSDYQAASGTLTFAPGETSKTITVPVIGDRLSEPNETFVVNLSSPTNATIADDQGVGTIVDDEPRISIGDMSKKEGNSGLTAFAFTVSLSAAYDVPVTVAYATADGTATAGSDYQAATGTLTIPAGQTSGTITVQAMGDRLPEPNETIFVNLSNLNYGVITRGQGVATIVDDEPRISIGDVSRYEGRRNRTTLFTFTVTLSTAYDQPVTMSYATANGTATTGDGDYLAKTGTLTFTAGETSKTISIVIQGDSKRESKETFYLDLFGNSSNSLFTKKRGLGTILNDD